ncbi:MAG: hypothetical protein M0C28_38140 [Candidatus Moduliflexus flocculans]|nr:hypothetical protein [Candidatus Moduliflexus flocculans]
MIRKLALVLPCSWSSGRPPPRGRHPVRARLRLDPGPADHEHDLRQPLSAAVHAGRTATSPARPTRPSASRAKTTYGLNGFFNVLFTENFGLQVLADYHRPGFGGANGPYEIGVQFQGLRARDLRRLDRLAGVDREPHRDGLQPQRPGPLPRRRQAVPQRLGRPQRLPLRGQGRAHRLHRSSSSPRSATSSGSPAGPTAWSWTSGRRPSTAPTSASRRPTRRSATSSWPSTSAITPPPRTPLQLHVVEDDLITRPIDEIEATIGLGTLDVNPSYIRAGLAIRFIF